MSITLRVAAVLGVLGLAACATHSIATETAMTAPFPPSADRPPPPKVEPVVKDGVRYQRKIGGSSDAQVGGLLAAYDAKSGAELWTLVVYDNKRQPGLEGDVQDIFFASMKFDKDGKLIIVDETGRRFAVDVKARTSAALR